MIVLNCTNRFNYSNYNPRLIFLNRLFICTYCSRLCFVWLYCDCIIVDCCLSCWWLIMFQFVANCPAVHLNLPIIVADYQILLLFAPRRRTCFCKNKLFTLWSDHQSKRLPAHVYGHLCLMNACSNRKNWFSYYQWTHPQCLWQMQDVRMDCCELKWN